ncbi:MAG: hypothetical protein KIS78_36995 [Labilithrix sp.]|nr:hypothetical protein [Labilithrix sp.]MCW5838047.1 hypothetical protein [Labilithrix sp.]
MERTYFNPAVETMADDARLAMQLAKLEEQLAYVIERSPFYARKLAGVTPARVRSLADLAALPFTEKSELLASQTAVPPLGEHLAAPVESVIRVHASSGTTGRPSYVAITRRDRDAWSEVVGRVYWCEGVRPADVIIHGFGLSFFVGGLPLKDAIEEIGAMFVPIGVGASERLVTTALDLRATQLTCTPSYTQYLADYCRDKRGVDPRELGFRRVMLGAEPGGGIPAVRERIARDFDAKVTEGLGNADLVPVYAASCDENDGMHFLAPDHLLLEVVDPETGRALPVEDGVSGELVATHLDREAAPLVRFRTRDRVTLSTTPCPCGRTGPRIRCLGRTDDMLIVNGVNVWPSAIRDVVEAFAPETTGAFEVPLSEPPPKVAPPLRLRVEHARGAVDLAALKKRLEGTLHDKLVVRADVVLVPEGTLPRFEMKASYLKREYEER